MKGPDASSQLCREGARLQRDVGLGGHHPLWASLRRRAQQSRAKVGQHQLKVSELRLHLELSWFWSTARAEKEPALGQVLVEESRKQLLVMGKEGLVSGLMAGERSGTEADTTLHQDEYFQKSKDRNAFLAPIAQPWYNQPWEDHPSKGKPRCADWWEAQH